MVDKSNSAFDEPPVPIDNFVKKALETGPDRLRALALIFRAFRAPRPYAFCVQRFRPNKVDQFREADDCIR